MIDLVRVGEKIAALRAERSMSQEELAQKLYVSRQAVSAWEVGKSAPSIDNVIELARLYKVSFEEILCLNEPALTLSKHDLFEGRDRAYVIRGVSEGKIQCDLPALFHECTGDERILLLRAIARGRLPFDERLADKLTKEEKVILEGGCHR